MNEIQIFSNPQFGEIRTAIGDNGVPMFCLADVCKALEIANASDTKSRLDEDGLAITEGIDSMGRTQQMTFVNEPNLYRCIFQSRKSEAKQFQKWVFDEVLPAIRRTGGYLAAKSDDTPEMIMARAVLVANDTIARQKMRIEEQQRQLREQHNLLLAQGEQIREKDKAIADLNVKTSYLDRILQSKSTVTTTQIAQDYGMSAKKFNTALKNLKIQRKVGGQWILYSPHNTMGYVHSETFVPENSSTGKVVMLTRWTQKGRLFLYDMLKRNSILPLIEQH